MVIRMGKIIVIEGTDCSGKETQTRLLKEYLQNNGVSVGTMSYPQYHTPTGRIIGGPLLGKTAICETWFDDPMNLDSKVASLLYAADRRASLPELQKLIRTNDIVILDRYVYSNMAHQGSKIPDPKKREELYHFLEELEFKLLELPKPDNVFFLYLPNEAAEQLRSHRPEVLDESEKNKQHQINSEAVFVELAELYHFQTINCVDADGQVKSIEEIHREIVGETRKLVLPGLRFKK